MVKFLSHADKKEIEKAVTAAEKQASAEIVVVTHEASSNYDDYILVFALILGSVSAAISWHCYHLTYWPFLLIVQLLPIAILAIPCIGKLFISFIPNKVLHIRAARKAFEEYFVITKQLPIGAPAVILFVSLAERHVRIMANNVVRAKVPDKKWNGVIAGFTRNIKEHGLKHAIIEDIEEITAVLKPHFKGKKKANLLSNRIK